MGQHQQSAQHEQCSVNTETSCVCLAADALVRFYVCACTHVCACACPGHEEVTAVLPPSELLFHQNGLRARPCDLESGTAVGSKRQKRAPKMHVRSSCVIVRSTKSVNETVPVIRTKTVPIRRFHCFCC